MWLALFHRHMLRGAILTCVGHNVLCQVWQPAAAKRGHEQEPDILHQVWHLSHPRETQDHHVPESLQESVRGCNIVS